MKTHIAPIYMILGLMAVATLSIGAGTQPAAASGSPHVVQVKPVPEPPGYAFAVQSARARAFQATSPGMAMPNRMIVLVSDKFEKQVEKRVAAALAEARARRKAG